MEKRTAIKIYREVMINMSRNIIKTVLNIGKIKINFNMIFHNEIFHCVAVILKNRKSNTLTMFRKLLLIKLNEMPRFHMSPLILIIFLSHCEKESQISSVTNLHTKTPFEIQIQFP